VSTENRHRKSSWEESGEKLFSEEKSATLPNEGIAFTGKNTGGVSSPSKKGGREKTFTTLTRENVEANGGSQNEEAPHHCAKRSVGKLRKRGMTHGGSQSFGVRGSPRRNCLGERAGKRSLLDGGRGGVPWNASKRKKSPLRATKPKVAAA